MEKVVRVSNSIARVADVIRRVSSSAIPSRSVLRLEELLWVREPVEDSGEFTATLLEYSSRLLIARRPYHGGVYVTPVGLDSSSRYLETPAADIVIGGVASMSSHGFTLVEWPSLELGYSPPAPHPVFYILPGSGAQLDIDDPLVSTVNPAGRSFDINYSVVEACDEMRFSLENWVLDLIPDLFNNLKLRNPVVLVDGPLYVVAKVLMRDAPLWLRETWAKLLVARVNAIRKLEDMGVPVLGVVKRVERSTILSKTRGLEGLRGDVLEGDKSIVLKSMLAIDEKLPGRIYVTPKILVRMPLVTGVGVLSKVVQYVVIPAGKYQLSPELARVFRVEYTPRTMELLGELGLDPVDVVSFDSVAKGALEPVSIKLSDWRSSFITYVLKRSLSMNIIRIGVPLGYWSLREAELSWGM